MDRLQAELQRLFPFDPAGPEGVTRVMLLELARPANWEAVARVWQGVQADLQLPAPAIAVSGTDAYQLWFSLAQPVPVGQALQFLQSLQRRYLGAVAPGRIRINPTSEGQQVERVPPVQAAPGQWAAFVAPDLAGLFADEPWLDLGPSPEAQAELLTRVQSIKPAELAAAMQSLAAPESAADPAARPVSIGRHEDPRKFLLAVMNDPAVDLALRIEAAKALLPAADRQRS
jgi:hypothetical protein